MRRIGVRRGLALGGIAALALTAGASTASAHHPGPPDPPAPIKLAVKHCIHEQQVLGPRAFHLKYGRHAMRNCVRAKLPHIRALIARAKHACATELAELGPEAFAEAYGVPGHPRIAFRKCVFSKVREYLAEHRDEFAAAVRECKAELHELGPRAFIEMYGPSHGVRHAFHKCVRTKLGEPDTA